jgi:hypothetical protein
MNWLKRNATYVSLIVFLPIALTPFWLPRLIVHAQQPDPIFVPGGTKIGYLTKDGAFILTEPTFWQMIEQHCAAVLVEDHVEATATTYGSIAPIYVEPPSVVHVPEKTLRLRCK